jgi:hypothetical protein
MEPRPGDVRQGLKLQVGSDEREFISLFPEVKMERLKDNDQLITINGVFRLRGSGPETWNIERLA